MPSAFFMNGHFYSLWAWVLSLLACVLMLLAGRRILSLLDGLYRLSELFQAQKDEPKASKALLNSFGQIIKDLPDFSDCWAEFAQYLVVEEVAPQEAEEGAQAVESKVCVLKPLEASLKLPSWCRKPLGIWLGLGVNALSLFGIVMALLFVSSASFAAQGAQASWAPFLLLLSQHILWSVISLLVVAVLGFGLGLVLELGRKKAEQRWSAILSELRRFVVLVPVERLAYHSVIQRKDLLAAVNDQTQIASSLGETNKASEACSSEVSDTSALRIELGLLTKSVQEMTQKGQSMTQSLEGTKQASEAIALAVKELKSCNELVASHWDEYCRRFEGVDQSLGRTVAETNQSLTAYTDKVCLFTEQLDQQLSKGMLTLAGAVGDLQQVVGQGERTKT